MAGADTMTLVEIVVADIGRAIGERFGDKEEEWFTGLLNTFAATVVARVLPKDEISQAEVLRKATEAGIDIDEVMTQAKVNAPTIVRRG
jgi:hypothetical protein